MGLVSGINVAQYSHRRSGRSQTERPGCVLKRLRKNKKAASFHRKSYPESMKNWSLTPATPPSSRNLPIPAWNLEAAETERAEKNKIK